MNNALLFITLLILCQILHKFAKNKNDCTPSGIECEPFALQLASLANALNRDDNELNEQLQKLSSELERIHGLACHAIALAPQKHALDFIEILDKINKLGKAIFDLQLKTINNEGNIPDQAKDFDEIIFSLNLLSLEAAVTAVKAGHEGKNFAHIAEALRTLSITSSEQKHLHA